MVQNIIIKKIPEETQKELSAIAEIYGCKNASTTVYFLIKYHRNLLKQMNDLKEKLLLTERKNYKLESQLETIKEFKQLLNDIK